MFLAAMYIVSIFSAELESIHKQLQLLPTQAIVLSTAGQDSEGEGV